MHRTAARISCRAGLSACPSSVLTCPPFHSLPYPVKLTYQTGLLEIHQEHESEGGIKKTDEPIRYSIESLLVPFITKGTIIRIQGTEEVLDSHFEIVSYKFESNDSKHLFTAIIREIETEEVVE